MYKSLLSLKKNFSNKLFRLDFGLPESIEVIVSHVELNNIVMRESAGRDTRFTSDRKQLDSFCPAVRTKNNGLTIR